MSRIVSPRLLIALGLVAAVALGAVLPGALGQFKAGQTGAIRGGQWIVEQPSDIHQAANRGSTPVSSTSPPCWKPATHRPPR